MNRGREVLEGVGEHGLGLRGAEGGVVEAVIEHALGGILREIEPLEPVRGSLSRQLLGNFGSHGHEIRAVRGAGRRDVIVAVRHVLGPGGEVPGLGIGAGAAEHGEGTATALLLEVALA